MPVIDLKQREEADALVAFAVDGSGDSGVSKPFEILHVGEFKRGTRSVPVTSEDLDAAVENFNRWKQMGQEIPVDYDHAFAEGREAPAAGWYASLERRDDSLYATVRWTAKARDEIKTEQYRFFSPEFSKNYTSETGDAEGFTILAGALTNRPFLRGMTPVALSQEVEDEIAKWAIEKVESMSTEERDGVADTSPSVPPEKNKKGDEVETFKVEIDGEEKEFTAEEIVALHADKATAEKTAAEKEAEAKASANQNETLSTRVDEMEKREKDRDFAEIFKQGQREGRLDAKDGTEETWRETFDALGPEKTKKLIEQVPAETVPMTQRGSGQAPASDADAPRGVDAKRHLMNQKVETFMQENPESSFKDALAHVENEMREKASA